MVNYPVREHVTNKKEYKDRYQGLQFGYLTVIHSYKDEKGYLKCLCKCKCGEEKEVYMSNLWGKKTRSCGCLARQKRIKPGELQECGDGRLEVGRTQRNKWDITGQCFGKLTAIRPLGAEKGKSMLWECRCDCGKLVRVFVNNLKNGHTRSCGCLKGVEQLGHIDGTSLTVIESKKVYKNNTSGIRGVSIYKNRCVAYLTFKGVRHNLGSYKNEEDAKAARLRAEQMYFQPFIDQIELIKKDKQ